MGEGTERGLSTRKLLGEASGSLETGHRVGALESLVELKGRDWGQAGEVGWRAECCPANPAEPVGFYTGK